jgi:SAM-dependent methyltransferase
MTGSDVNCLDAGKVTHKVYDKIGVGYNTYRKPDPRIAAALSREIGTAERIINIGAGAGSYEPIDRYLVALEPSWAMIEQHPKNGSFCVQGFSEALPFRDQTFDVGLAILTIHHWANIAKGLKEAMRVNKQRLILLTWIGFKEDFWLLDYLPQIKAINEAQFLSIEQLAEIMGPVRAEPIPIPHDCMDGFLCAYWRRPHVYLDKGARNAISIFSRLTHIEAGLQSLKNDLESGLWHKKYQDLLHKESMDFGYRIVVWDKSTG